MFPQLESVCEVLCAGVILCVGGSLCHGACPRACFRPASRPSVRLCLYSARCLGRCILVGGARRARTMNEARGETTSKKKSRILE
eukprot:scaffold21912_cov127-Isochrysis_galbana.AAC.2